MSKTAVPSAFRFKTTDTIGAAAAEDNNEFLEACFVDTGALRLLEDMSDRRLIVRSG